MFQLVAGPEWFLSFLRMNVVPPIAKYVVRLDPVKKFIFPTVSQIGINYRHSTLSQHAGDDGFKVKAGDRMPYFLVDGKSVYDKLHQPKFHWLVFADPPDDVQASQMELANEFGDLVDTQAIALSAQVAQAFGTEKSFGVLLRPDNYIGFIARETTLRGLRLYLKWLAE
jgi:hypothetical protein